MLDKTAPVPGAEDGLNLSRSAAALNARRLPSRTGRVDQQKNTQKERECERERCGRMVSDTGGTTEIAGVDIAGAIGSRFGFGYLVGRAPKLGHRTDGL